MYYELYKCHINLLEVHTLKNVLSCCMLDLQVSVSPYMYSPPSQQCPIFLGIVDPFSNIMMEPLTVLFTQFSQVFTQKSPTMNVKSAPLMTFYILNIYINPQVLLRAACSLGLYYNKESISYVSKCTPRFSFDITHCILKLQWLQNFPYLLSSK